jgi:hypothetical protein
LTNEESSTRASISRIVMLAEALFEVVFFSELASRLCMGSLSLSLPSFLLFLLSAGKLCCQKCSNTAICQQTVLFGPYQGSISMVWEVSWGLHVCVFHNLFHHIILGLFGILPEYFPMVHVSFQKINRLVFVTTLGFC